MEITSIKKGECYIIRRKDYKIHTLYIFVDCYSLKINTYPIRNIRNILKDVDS
jgi:hypothetical protein